MMTIANTTTYNIRGILQEMRDDYRRAVEGGEEAQSVETREYVVFRLGGELFGFASRFAKEVLRLPRLVPVPRLPEQIAGIFNLRGQIVAVTDLRPFLRIQEKGKISRCQVVVVEAAGLVTALLTEGVEGIRTIPVASIEPVTEGLSGFPREAAEGHVPLEGGLLVLLNLETILARPEFTVDQKSATA